MTLQFRDISKIHPATAAVTIAAGGTQLAGCLHRPRGRPKAAAVLHGATGVPQGYYQAFAAWLAEDCGIACLTYDYRDFGASAKVPVRRSRATLAHWGLVDQAAALKAIGTLAPDVPVWVIGHSLGGAMLPYQRDLEAVARVIIVAAGCVHVSDHPWPYQALARLFWQGHGPLLTGLLGYMPGRISGFGPDLPRGVYWQWRRWCLSRNYHLADAGRTLPLPDPRAVIAPVKFVALADDVMVPEAAVWRLMRFFPEAVKRQLVLRPSDHGLKAIGHLGVFNRRCARLWPELIA